MLETWINSAYDYLGELRSEDRHRRYVAGGLTAEEWIGVVPALPLWPDTIDWQALEVEGIACDYQLR